ncbi:MAG: glycosyltransferase family 39 protein [Candidatus Njordarchaeales archaeon]
MARNLFSNGQFTSKVGVLYYKLGFNPHLVVYFSYALFFLISGVSYTSVKLATLFYGTTILFPIFFLLRETYNEKIALLSVFLITIHPMTLFFASIPIHGTEIVASAFLFSTVYFLHKGINEQNPKYSAVAGLFAFNMLAARGEYLYILVLVLPLLLLVERSSNKRFILKTYLLTLPILLLRKSDFYAAPRSYLISCLPFVLFIINVITYRKYECSILSNLAIFNIILTGLVSLCLLKWYELIRFKSQILTYSVVAHKYSLISSLIKFIRGSLMLRSLNPRDLLLRFMVVWKKIIIKTTHLVLLFSILSLKFLRKSGTRLLLPSYALVFSIIFSMSGLPIEGLDHHRFLLPIFFILIILASPGIILLLKALTILTKKAFSLKFNLYVSQNIFLKFKKSNVNNLLALFIILASLLCLFHPIYRNELTVVRATDIRVAYKYDPAIDWVLENSPKNSLIIAYKPCEWAWYTERPALQIGGRHISFDELCKSIKKCRGNYFIIDETAYLFYLDPKIKSLYLRPLPGFIQVFRSEGEPHVVIYDVTPLWGDC